MPLCKRLLLMVLLGLVASPGCRFGRGGPAVPFPKNPNIVLVLVDALRRDHLGIYSYQRPTSPFLDQLGSEGVVFDNAYAQASQTFNSTSILFTSRVFPFRGGPRGDRHRQLSIAQANVALAEVLRDNGYDTLGVFTNPYHYSNSGFWQGFSTPRYLRCPRCDAVRVIDTFVEWLGGRSDERPFLAYLHFMDVHYPYRPPREFAKMFVTQQTQQARRPLYTNGKPDTVPTEDELEFMKARYDGEIRYVDSQLERMAFELKRRGLWEDTVVIVTSDHGDEFMEHGGLGHGVTLEKEMVWIPMILHSGRGTGATGQRVDALVRNLDLAPTILNLVGLPIPDEFEGDTLLPLLRGRRQADDAHSYAWQGLHRSITTRRWHFVWHRETQQARLYDSRTDPEGLHDVAADHPGVVEEFRDLLEEYEANLRKTNQIAQELQEMEDPEESQIDPKILEQLRALGYLK